MLHQLDLPSTPSSEHFDYFILVKVFGSRTLCGGLDVGLEGSTFRYSERFDDEVFGA